MHRIISWDNVGSLTPPPKNRQRFYTNHITNTKNLLEWYIHNFKTLSSPVCIVSHLQWSCYNWMIDLTANSFWCTCKPIVLCNNVPAELSVSLWIEVKTAVFIRQSGNRDLLHLLCLILSVLSIKRISNHKMRVCFVSFCSPFLESVVSRSKMHPETGVR